MFPALSRGDSALAVILFDQEYSVDLVNKETRETPLALTCHLGNVRLARECLKRGALNDPYPGFGQSALQAAVAAWQDACVRSSFAIAVISCGKKISIPHDRKKLVMEASPVTIEVNMFPYGALFYGGKLKYSDYPTASKLQGVFVNLFALKQHSGAGYVGLPHQFQRYILI